MQKLLFLVLLSFLAQPAYARKGLWATQFQLGGVRSVPTQTKSSAFVHFGWTPVYKIKGGGFRGELGFTGLQNDYQERYLSMNTQVFAYRVLFSLVAVEGGAGVQTGFHDAGGTHPMLTANLVLSVEGDFIDRMVMGYSRVFVPGNGTDQFYSGVGFKI